MDKRSAGRRSAKFLRPVRATRAFMTGAAVAILILLIAGTWVSATLFQSPAQREANAAAPAPQPVFAVVTKGTLSDQSAYSGIVSYSNETSLKVTPAEAGRSVVTGSPAPVGAAVSSGELLTEVNTRPVFLVASPFDFFRNVGFGDEGADVRVLQEALVERGYLDHVDESYGAQTARAVTRWYLDAGYDAPTRQRPASSVSTSTTADPSRSVSQSGDTESPSPKSSEPSQSPVDSGRPNSNVTPQPIFDAFVPLPELLAVPSLPATIIGAPAIGAHVGGDTPDLVLGSSALIVRSTVPATEAAGIERGSPVTVVSDSGQVSGVIADIQEQAASEDAASNSMATVSVSLDAAAVSLQRGATVTVQVTHEIIADNSLIVPTTAVVGRGVGHGVLVKRESAGTLLEVPVSVVGTLRGMTAVAPEEAGALAEGDDVRVG